MKEFGKGDMKSLSNVNEKRKHPRVTVSLPLHIQADENEGVYPGLTIEASDSGLLIQTLKEMPVGTRIDIEALFPKKLNMANFKAEAEVVCKDICRRGDLDGYQYELEFVQVSDEDRWKLNCFLGNRFESEGILPSLCLQL